MTTTPARDRRTADTVPPHTHRMTKAIRWLLIGTSVGLLLFGGAVVWLIAAGAHATDKQAVLVNREIDQRSAQRDERERLAKELADQKALAVMEQNRALACGVLAQLAPRTPAIGDYMAALRCPGTPLAPDTQENP